ncbi:MAG: hypothetical protein KME21_30205 [Desmonostoc vinosum HA7617-LM4]|jgi:hypothetical protein|nr:hypothetical protein [Desmonostoc vinosum HA7617-LM4]
MVEENLLIIEFVAFVVKTNINNTFVVYICLHGSLGLVMPTAASYTSLDNEVVIFWNF